MARVNPPPAGGIRAGSVISWPNSPALTLPRHRVLTPGIVQRRYA